VEQLPSTVQSPRQAVAPQMNSPQGCVWGAGQAPVPLQSASSVATPAVQEPARHSVAWFGYAQAKRPTPSQAPPHAEPSVAQGVRLPCGASVTGEQTPSEPATSQASHWRVHALPQQTPSTQFPLLQSPAATQATPAASWGVQPLVPQ
jgi:hypothetical protein